MTRMITWPGGPCGFLNSLLYFEIHGCQSHSIVLYPAHPSREVKVGYLPSFTTYSMLLNNREKSIKILSLVWITLNLSPKSNFESYRLPLGSEWGLLVYLNLVIHDDEQCSVGKLCSAKLDKTGPVEPGGEGDICPPPPSYHSLPKSGTPSSIAPGEVTVVQSRPYKVNLSYNFTAPLYVLFPFR